MRSTSSRIPARAPSSSCASSRPSSKSADLDVTEEKIATVRKLNAIAWRRGQSMGQLALAWTLRLPQVTSALIGASRPEQIKDCVAMLKNPTFTPAELKEIEGILAK
ncbi:MAG: aldo/keto reductase [Verrucomicrobia bacterium]|nr:aldo/keto reductase [Verrucomicrobiota bacterium]